MKQVLLPAFLMTALVACKKNTGPNGGDGSDDIEKFPPVETRSPNTGYSPAFQGQTRTFGIKTKAELDIKVLNGSLLSPWGLAALPNGNWLITQKAGTMVVLNADGSLKSNISGLPAVNSAGQGGLLDIALDPQFGQNRMVYWTFSENVSGGTVTAVAKGRLSDAENAIENIETIYRALPAHNGTLHYGGRLVFDNSGHIFVGTGDRSDLVTRPLAQDKTKALGKVLRITKDGQAAPGNPFDSGSDALREIYSYGHRNVQGLAFDAETNTLWQTEHGPRGGDEVNKILAGKDFGWPAITYGIEYGGGPVGDGLTQMEGMEQPSYYWDPSISPGSAIVYRGDHHSEWNGDLLIGALNGQHIIRLRSVNGKVEGEERLLESEGQRFRAVACGIDGKLYAVTDQGRFYQVGKK